MRFPDNEPIPLWNGPAPMAMGDSPQDIPTITAFYPREWKRNGKAVIVFPGGGYCNLTAHEGDPFAIWLAENGFTAFVCRYRICKGDRKYHHPVMLSDALRAIRMVRYHAADMKIRPDMIGAIGGSAGAHLAGCCGNLHEMGLRQEGEPEETVSGRPDFLVLCYPATSYCEPYRHEGSGLNLYGADADPETIRLLSLEKTATADTPQTFLWHTWTDPDVKVMNSIAYAARLTELGVRCELHVYGRDGHGIGLADGHPWTTECLRFLNEL
ncbi:MAG: alpha/beta hydrolase [Lentisphaeria bacterium]|nr:alpha/beta hydrolase [Lentisphaeria bacterium]